MEKKHNLYLSKAEEVNQDFIVEQASISKYRTLRVHFLLCLNNYSNYYDVIIPKPDLLLSKLKLNRHKNQEEYHNLKETVYLNEMNNNNFDPIDEAFRKNKVFFETIIDLINDFLIKTSYKGTINRYITSRGRLINDFGDLDSEECLYLVSNKVPKIKTKKLIQTIEKEKLNSVLFSIKYKNLLENILFKPNPKSLRIKGNFPSKPFQSSEKIDENIFFKEKEKGKNNHLTKNDLINVPIESFTNRNRVHETISNDSHDLYEDKNNKGGNINIYEDNKLELALKGKLIKQKINSMLPEIPIALKNSKAIFKMAKLKYFFKDSNSNTSLLRKNHNTVSEKHLINFNININKNKANLCTDNPKMEKKPQKIKNDSTNFLHYFIRKSKQEEKPRINDKLKSAYRRDLRNNQIYSSVTIDEGMKILPEQIIGRKSKFNVFSLSKKNLNEYLKEILPIYSFKPKKPNKVNFLD